MNYIEITAVIFTAISVYLAYKRNMWTWPLGIIGVIAYSVFFLESNAVANAALQVYYILQCLYGWYYWSSTKVNDEVIPKFSTQKMMLVYIFSSSVLYIAISLFCILVLGMPNNAMTDLDAMTTAISIVASFMLARKLVYSWVLWVLVDFMYIYMFLSNASYVSAVLYLGLLIISGKAYFDWSFKAIESEKAHETV